MTDLRLKLIRLNHGLDYCEGDLIYLNDNTILCNTLEDKVRDINGDGDLLDDGENKIYGKTAIPYTKPNEPYKLEVVYSQKFKKKMVAVMGVPHFTAIRLHGGTNVDHSLGCPLCGERTTHGRMKNTGMTEKLVSLLEKHGGKGTLEII